MFQFFMATPCMHAYELHISLTVANIDNQNVFYCFLGVVDDAILVDLVVDIICNIAIAAVEIIQITAFKDVLDQ